MFATAAAAAAFLVNLATMTPGVALDVIDFGNRQVAVVDSVTTLGLWADNWAFNDDAAFDARFDTMCEPAVEVALDVWVSPDCGPLPRPRPDFPLIDPPAFTWQDALLDAPKDPSKSPQVLAASPLMLI